MFLAIDHSVEGHYKHKEFATLAEAEQHKATYLPNGFAIADPGGDANFWVVDMVAETVTQDTSAEAKAAAITELNRLEASITPRRMREHSLGTGGTWLADVDALIAIERAKL